MSNPLKSQARSDYAHFLSIPTRWMDNDIYGHVNNVNYYSFFDTAVNRYLIDAGVLDIHNGSTVGFVVETQCQYFAPIAFPDTVHAGIRVAQLGNRSVRYEVGLFRNDDSTPAAAGHFVHVYVDRASNQPVTIPDHARAAMQALVLPLPEMPGAPS
ncbi:acyl-CoA thioesterase [Perlucidibaca aquatica]|uniref:acyl-CoA thioesterase n=1 Tax=Perlucidibaca aquatica TaxID=1852776 RepID=UPI00083A9E65|nr:thioesterase family protein [Perlucidibaca aquatica]